MPSPQLSTSQMPGRLPGPRSVQSASIADVARLAGVSAQTVSRVSTGAQNVRPETKERVLKAMAQLGYTPNQAARALRDGRFKTIGVITQQVSRTDEALIAAAIVEAAAEKGYSINLFQVAHPETEQLTQAGRRLSQQSVDGLIIIQAGQAQPAALNLPANMPVVASDSAFIDIYPSVVHNQEHGVNEAMRHLLDLGHQRIAHITGPSDSRSALLRRVAWRRSLEEAGYPAPDPYLTGPSDSRSALLRRAVWRRSLEEAGYPAPDPYLGDWSAKSGYRAGKAIAEDPEVTAVFCANDEIAFGLMRAFHDAGRRVPDDVSVVGFDGIELSEFSAPALTTVRQDFHSVGRELVDLLLEQMHQPSRSHAHQIAQRVVPSELVIRDSTAQPRAL